LDFLGEKIFVNYKKLCAWASWLNMAIMYKQGLGTGPILRLLLIWY
jgi:hypothetical protein